METAKLDETDAAKTAYPPNSEVLPLIETVRAKNQRLHIELVTLQVKKNHLSKNWWRFDRNLKQSAPIGRKLRQNFSS
jgi:hypothetical protein